MKNIINPRPIYLSIVMVVLGLAACRSEPTADTHRQAQAAQTDTAGATAAADSSDGAEQVVLILGNSLTAGYGVDRGEAFPALLRQKSQARGWDVDIVNAGLSGDTSAGGLSRLDWVLRRPIDVLVLELGGNDGLQGVDPQVTKKNLTAIIDSTRARYPDVRVVLTGLRLPPNLGSDYTHRFAQIYPDLAATKEVTLVPSLMKGVAGVDSLMQADGIHPTAAGQRILAQNVWRKLEPILAAGCGASQDPALTDTSRAMSLDALTQSADTAGAGCADPKGSS